MFKHILEGWIRQYRDIETDGIGDAAGADPAPVEEAPNPPVVQEEAHHTDDGWPEGTPDWVKKRISQVSQQKRELSQQNADLQRRLEELERVRQTPTEEQIAGMSEKQLAEYVDALAAQKARQLAQETAAQQTQAQRWKKIEEDGGAAHGEEFMRAGQRLAEAGVGGPAFAEVLQDMDEAADLIAYLGQHQNIAEAQRISSLPPVKMALELAKLGPKAKAAFKQPRTRAPEPPNPVGTKSAVSAGAMPPTGTPEWFAWRQKQVDAKRS